MFYPRRIFESSVEPNDTNVLWLYVDPITGTEELRTFTGAGWVPLGGNNQGGGGAANLNLTSSTTASTVVITLSDV